MQENNEQIESLEDFILNQMQQELEDEHYQRLKFYLQQRKKEQVRKLLKEHLSTKAFKKFEQHIDKLTEKKNKPLQNAKYLRPFDGIGLYLVYTARNAIQLKGETKAALVVGMTGVGKSTFLNSLTNYILGVEADDSFRYLIVDDFKCQQSMSVTTEVTTYVIPRQGKMKYNFVLIDVPGMGDTRGIETDKKNLAKIKENLEKNVPELNLILYVFKASDTRITAEVQYVMSQIMGMFAKDVAANFLFILTFADLKIPPIVEPLRKNFEGVIKGLNKEDWYLKVNNSAMFMKINPNDPIEANAFATSMSCLQKTINKLIESRKVSTQKTVSVMDKTKQIANLIRSLQSQMDTLLENQDELRQLAKMVSNTKADALGKSGYIFTVKQNKVRRIPTKQNVTSCLNCKFSCHIGCAFSDGSEKVKCCAMGTNGYCKCCYGKCHWKSHTNQFYIFEHYTEIVQKTNQDLLQQYKIAIGDKDAKQKLLSKMVFNCNVTVRQTDLIIKQLKKANEELIKLQLLQVQSSSIIEYLEQLIINEKSSKKPGHLERLRQLEYMKKMEERKVQALKKANNNQFLQEEAKQQIESIIEDKEIRNSVLRDVRRRQSQSCAIM